MKKVIGVFALLFTMLVYVIYRQLTTDQAKARSEKACQSWPLRDGLFFTALLLQ